MDNPHVQILGHPTGRLIGSREPVDLDMEAVVDAAKEREVVLEINAQPERLDLNDVYAKMAKERSVAISISTDAHSASGLTAMRYGVSQARRGWLTSADVVNTRSWGDVKKMLRS
jgi:DNA polymerase (family 10)